MSSGDRGRGTRVGDAWMGNGRMGRTAVLTRGKGGEMGAMGMKVEVEVQKCARQPAYNVDR